MRKFMMMILVLGILTGCVVEEERIEERQMNTEKIKKGASDLLEKKMEIPVTYQDSQFRVYDLMLGDEEERIKKVLGEPVKETAVEDNWRFDKVMSYKKGDVQINIALFKGKIDDITITLTDKNRYEWKKFKSAFNGLIYEATSEFVESQEEIKKIQYYVSDEEDQWTVLQEREDGSVILSTTYTYDLLVLKENQSIVEK